jgi:hypothetical protein
VYRKQGGKRGNSSVFAADYPPYQMMGPARVIDVTHLLGKNSPSEGTKSAAITLGHVKWLFFLDSQ